MDNNLKTLTMVYIWGLVLLLVTTICDLRANVRAIILLIGYLPISIVHLNIFIGFLKRKARKFFVILTVLWASEVILVVLSEGLNFFYDTQVLPVDFLNLIVLIVIAVIVFISFLLNSPFFYAKTTSKTLVFAGILGLLCTLWVATMIALSFVDLYWSHWSYITKTFKPSQIPIK